MLRAKANRRTPRPAGDWRPAELATFARIVETLVGADEPEASAIARACATRMERHLDPDRVRGIRAFLVTLELPLVGAAFGGSRRPFSALDRAGRERELRGWATSRFVWRRAVFQAVKRLAAFRAYADPAPAARPNPLLAGLGYTPSVEPVTDAPTPITAFELPGGGRDEATVLDADVVVVGSGAGGSVVARELARAGRSVLVLEAGPLVLEPDMPTDEANAYDRMFLDGALTSTWWGSMTIVAGHCVGGGTTVNWAACIAPGEAIRAEWARDHGLEGLDGPAAEEDIATLRDELGFDRPPSIPPKDQLILDGAAAMGVHAEPLARNATGCTDCGSCGFGCRVGAKRSTLRVHLADAGAAGARIVPRAVVRSVRIEGGRARGVGGVVQTAAGPRRFVVRADQVVVAAGGLRTPGILERSGVAHPAVGRYLRLHPVALLAAIRAEPVEMWRGTMQAAHSLAWAPGTAAAAGHAGFVVESIPGHLGLLAIGLPWTSTAAFRGLMRRAPFVSPLIAITRDSGWGTVRQTRSGRARVDYPLEGRTVTTLRAGLRAAADLARAGGSVGAVAPGDPGAWFAEPGSDLSDLDLPGRARGWADLGRRLDRLDYSTGRGVVLSAHQMGTARMGAHAADHAVDSDGRVRSAARPGAGDQVVRGLYVADASLLPTGIGINPMVTIMLLARRVARTVLAEGAGGGVSGG